MFIYCLKSAVDFDRIFITFILDLCVFVYYNSS